MELALKTETEAKLISTIQAGCSSSKRVLKILHLVDPGSNDEDLADMLSGLHERGHFVLAGLSAIGTASKQLTLVRVPYCLLDLGFEFADLSVRSRFVKLVGKVAQLVCFLQERSFDVVQFGCFSSAILGGVSAWICGVPLTLRVLATKSELETPIASRINSILHFLGVILDYSYLPGHRSADFNRLENKYYEAARKNEKQVLVSLKKLYQAIVALRFCLVLPLMLFACFTIPSYSRVSLTYLCLKRFLDLVFSVVLSGLLMPIFLGIMFLRLLTGQPAINKTWILGRNNKPFKKLDFGSGAFASLPVILNIVLGDMSFVGPRITRVSEESRARVNNHIQMRPGLFGSPQLSWYSEINDAELNDLDRIYNDNVSFLIDCQILGKSISRGLRKLVVRVS